MKTQLILIIGISILLFQSLKGSTPSTILVFDSICSGKIIKMDKSSTDGLTVIVYEVKADKSFSEQLESWLPDWVNFLIYLFTCLFSFIEVGKRMKGINLEIRKK